MSRARAGSAEVLEMNSVRTLSISKSLVLNLNDRWTQELPAVKELLTFRALKRRAKRSISLDVVSKAVSWVQCRHSLCTRSSSISLGANFSIKVHESKSIKVHHFYYWQLVQEFRWIGWTPQLVRSTAPVSVHLINRDSLALAFEWTQFDRLKNFTFFHQPLSGRYLRRLESICVWIICALTTSVKAGNRRLQSQ